MKDREQFNRVAHASRVLASASSRSRTFAGSASRSHAIRLRKIVSARRRRNGCEATAGLSNQHARRVRYPETTMQL